LKLWLDDVRPAPEGWIWVRTAWDAIEQLSRGSVVEVSLDHDLGGPENGTGQHVASWIEAEAFHARIKPVVWKIHSANPIGAERMRIALERADSYWRSRQVSGP
jgi:hypothetical protein